MLLAAIAAAGFGLPPQDPPRPGFLLTDQGFAGIFANAVPDTLRLQNRGDRFVGTLIHGAEHTIDARVVDGALRGTANILGVVQAFACTRDGEDLRIRVGGDEFAVRRTVEPLAALTDLGAPIVDPKRRWTVAIYFGADNDLEENALADLAEIAALRDLPGVDVIAFIDRWNGPPADAEHDWTDCRVLHLRPGQPPTVLQQPGELASNDPATLAGFLIGAYRKFPAPQRAVVLWDHGGGWFGMISDEDAPGGRTGSMRMPQLRHGLRTAALATGTRLDLVVADACLMAQVDSALSLQGLAQILVASQTEVAGTGLPYGPALSAFAVPDSNAESVATAMVSAFEQFYREQKPDPNATLSAIRLDAVPAIARHLDQVAGHLLPHVDKIWPRLLRSIYYGESGDTWTQRTEKVAPCALDVVDVVKRVAAGWPDFPAKAAQMLLEKAVRQAVFAQGRGDQRALAGGFSAFMPRVKAQAPAIYANTPLGAGNQWWQLLTAALDRAAADKTPVTVADLSVRTFGGEVATEVRPLDGAAVHFVATGNSIVQAQQWDLVHDPDAKAWIVLRKNFVADPTWPQRAQRPTDAEIDLLMPQFVDGRNELRSELFGLDWSIQNSTTRIRATIDLTGDASTTPITASARLRHPGWKAPKNVAVLFGRASWIVERVVVTEALTDGLTDRTVVPTADSEFTFLLEAIGEDGKGQVIECDPIRYEQGLRLVLSADEPGRYKAALLVDTVGGQRAIDEVDYTLAANPDVAAWTATWPGFKPELLRGRWPHLVADGPDKWRETAASVEFVERLNPDKPIYRVRRKLTQAPDGEHYLQTWIFDLAGVPNLRILTPMADGRVLCWFGPVMRTVSDARPALVFKALNVDSGLWMFRMSLHDSLRLKW
ncbi:MAG: hypothetical protein IPK26_04285 [Planctomycetes bacterium]|nr:hypothetical protein [Planctomycetota bacterium]